MRTLLFTLEYPPFNGGVANYYGSLAQYWPLGQDLLILDNSRQKLIVSEVGYFSWWPAFPELYRKVKKERIDYLLVGQILPLGTVACFFSFFWSTKYAVFLHGMDLAYGLKTPWKKWLTTLILKRADKIIAANSYVAERAKELGSSLVNKVLVVNPGIPGGLPKIEEMEIRALKNDYNLEGKTVLFSLGRLVSRKGFDKTIQALTRMSEEEISTLIYFIAGTGPKEEHLKEMVPLRFAKKINFLGELSENEKWLWLSSADIFIMPSRDIAGDFEGFGIVYLEANLAGKPVIAGNSGGVRDAVVNNLNGLLVNSEDISEIKEAILRLAANPEERKKLGEQGKARAIKDFNWENQAEKIFNFIKL